MSGIVGREQELHSVDRFLEAARTGPAALVIEGDAGIGKTTVWREGVQRASAQGFEVLSCQPAETEAKLSYASVADLLATVPDREFEDLPEPQSHALGVALLRVEPKGAPPDQRAIGTALGSLLTRLAARRPVLVAVDDVQWLDRPSAGAVSFAGRRLGSHSLGFLLARRTGADGGDIPLALPAVMRVELRGLSVGSLFHIAREQFGEALPRPALLKIEQLSGGNPFYALGLARAFIDSGSAPEGWLGVPDSLSALLEGHLKRVPAPAIDALVVAAATSASTVSLIERVLGRDPRADLAAAEAAGVVEVEGERVRFAHPLFASAVYSAAGHELRRKRHRELAAVVEDPEERARHLAHSSSEPSEGVASALDTAAARATARGAPEAAAELSELAARLTPEGDERAKHRRTLESAQSSIAAGDPDRARRVVEQLLDEPLSPADRGKALRLLGEIRWYEGSFPDAIRFLEEALPYLDDPQVAIPARFDLAVAYVSTMDAVAALEQARLGLAEAEAHGEPGLLAEALGVSAMVDFMTGQGAERPKLERALELEDRDRPTQLMLRPSSIAAMIAVYDARLSEGCERLYEIREWAYSRGEDAALPFLIDHVAWAEWWRGDFEASSRAVEEALELSEQAGSKTNRTAPLVHRAIVRGLRGETEAAFEDIAAATALFQEVGWTFGLSWAITAAGAIRVAQSDMAAAAQTLAPLVEATEATGVVEPVWTLFVPDAIEALTARGEADRAEMLLGGFESQALRLDRRWAIAEAARCRAVVLAARGELDEALAAAEEALAKHGELELPIERGRTLLALGRVRRRRREKLLAKETLEAALDLFEELGATLWAQQARSELGRVGLRRASSPSALTESERRVAELAAEGRTTNEVAQVLSVSPKTVEASLSRVYGKLGIRSRAELGAWMAKQSARAKT